MQAIIINQNKSKMMMIMILNYDLSQIINFIIYFTNIKILNK